MREKQRMLWANDALKYAKSINDHGYLDGTIFILKMKAKDAERAFLRRRDLEFKNSPIDKL